MQTLAIEFKNIRLYLFKDSADRFQKLLVNCGVWGGWNRCRITTTNSVQADHVGIHCVWVLTKREYRYANWIHENYKANNAFGGGGIFVRHGNCHSLRKEYLQNWIIFISTDNRGKLWRLGLSQKVDKEDIPLALVLGRGLSLSGLWCYSSLAVTVTCSSPKYCCRVTTKPV